MSSEIEVPETPNWLQELEAKRERRLKARLAHETGAGAPCLKCGDKCPGLDLHFWRKCCKICKCSKEEHEVQDDDIYGWAQFQLLGSKPNKIKTKIVLPGKKDEVELDWAPKGHKETVDKYLKTLPPEQLAVKGSQAAQDRKQLLQKQIPVHDIDPTLCHELTEDELNKMNDYVNHVKQASVGIGQIVSLSSIIKGNLHKLNPNDAAIIASRYAKGVPLSEIVKLQSQNRASLLKSQNLNQELEKLGINDPSNRSLPVYKPNSHNTTEQNIHPLVGNKIHDVNYPGYTRDINQTLSAAQFSNVLKPNQQKGYDGGQNQPPFDPTIDEKLLQGTNFDPKSLPSHFLNQAPGYKPPEVPTSAFVPYSKAFSDAKPGSNVTEENSPSKLNYASNLPRHNTNKQSGFKSGELSGDNVPGNYGAEQSYKETVSRHPNYSQNLLRGPGNRGASPGYKSGLPQGQFATSGSESSPLYENVEEMKRKNPQGLPSYIPGKYNVHSEIQSPTKVPKNVKDLAFSTYDQDQIDPNETEYTRGYSELPNIPGQPQTQYPGGIDTYKHRGLAPNEINYNTNESNLQPTLPGQSSIPYGLKPGDTGGSTVSRTSPSNRTGAYPSGFRPVQPGGGYAPNSAQSDVYPLGNQSGNAGQAVGPGDDGFGQSNVYPTGPLSGVSGGHLSGYNNKPTSVGPSEDGFNKNVAGHVPNVPYENYPGGSASGVPAGNIGVHNKHIDHGTLPGDSGFNQNTSSNFENISYENYPTGPMPGVPAGHGNKPGKKLSELHPGKITVDEDFLQPSQVSIGAIQDINYPEIKAATHGTNDFYEDYSPDSLREILNNIILPDCHYCKKPFEENEFAITIDRANVLFHAECFKCAGCNQILADNVYFYNKETDNVYCGRDYAKIRGFPRCKACDELIFTKEYCLAENSTFHLKHFCCIECDKPLAGQDYTLEDEMPYCLPCFEQSKASKCSSCCRVIKPDEVGCTLNGVHFHANDDCFACKMCQKPLMGKKLLLRNGKLYCSHDCFGADK